MSTPHKSAAEITDPAAAFQAHLKECSRCRKHPYLHCRDWAALLAPVTARVLAQHRRKEPAPMPPTGNA